MESKTRSSILCKPERATLPAFQNAETPARETGPIHAAKRGAPDFAHAQRDEILRLLREAKDRGEGVDKVYLIYERHFSQAAARIFELEKMGYVIRHETRPGQKYVSYFLVSEPAQEKPLPNYQPKGPDRRQSTFASSSDWYTRQTKRERPKEVQASPGPLFAGVADR